jgi:hypothetical protein
MKFQGLAAGLLAASAVAISAPAVAATTIAYDLTSASTSTTAPPGTLVFGDLTVWGVTYTFGPNGNGGTGDASDFGLTGTYQDFNGVGVCQPAEDASQCKTNDTLNTKHVTDENEALVFQFDHEVTLTSVGLTNFQPNSRFTLWRVEADNSLTDLFEFDGVFGTASPFTPPNFGSYKGQTFALTNKGSNHNGYQVGNLSVAGVPEPGTWALMILGFGGAGAMLRRQRVALA